MIELSSLSRRIISSIPNTALIGVLISCDMLARNLLFASFARFASSAIFSAVSEYTNLSKRDLLIMCPLIIPARENRIRVSIP